MYAWNDFLKVGLNHPFINIPVQMHERDSHTYIHLARLVRATVKRMFWMNK